MIPAETIERVIDSVRISAVVSREVKLKRSGHRWVGLCIFHQERTPSLTCDDQRGTFKCFGCGEGGNAIDFLRKVHGWSFIEAIEALASEAGVTIESTPEQQAIAARKLSDLDVLNRVRLWFQSQLQRCGSALSYLKSRGVTDDHIATFGIGYAPTDPVPFQSLAGGSDHDVLSRTGLGLAAFRDRITFPIRDRRGRTLGFGGRSLTTAGPKYLNTPETDLFHKRDRLFGEDLAVPGPLYVVEGYIDVVACRHFGLSAVAPMGTALSETQLKNLWRISDSPILAFDGDEAGRRATRRALELAFKHLEPGYTLRTAKLASGRDPGSYLGSPTGEGLKRPLACPVELAEAFWQSSTDGLIGGPDRLAKLERDMLDVLYTIPNRQLREKYIWDCRQRIRTLARPRPQIRANGHSFHSTNPATKRLLQHPDGMTIKQALEIIHSQADGDALHEAQQVLAGVGLWPINESPSSSVKGSA